jgi:hypothetical protein
MVLIVTEMGLTDMKHKKRKLGTPNKPLKLTKNQVFNLFIKMQKELFDKYGHPNAIEMKKRLHADLIIYDDIAPDEVYGNKNKK